MCDAKSRGWMAALSCLLVALPLAACAPAWQSTQAKISRIDRALGASHASRSKYLRYTTTSDAGAWTREIVVTPSAYAEQRTRSDGSRYAFGHDPQGGWLRIGDGEIIEASASMWDQEARTGAALFGLHFAEPRQEDEAAYMGRRFRSWELAYRPAGGRTLTFSVDTLRSEPTAYDVVDDFGRLVSCGDLSIGHGETGPVLASFRCSTNDRFGFAGQVLHEDVRLETDQALDVAAAPSWAHPEGARVSPPPLTRPVEVPITYERRLEIPTRAGDRDPVSLIVDTGAFFTILSREGARALGVVPTGETRMHVDPPWLARTHLWVGVVPKMSLAGATLYGERVLVAESQDFGDKAGLLGQSTLRRFILDVDSPARMVRLWPRESFRGGRRLVRLYGSEIPTLDGEVLGVAKGRVMLDTGMEEDIVVHAFAMSVVHKRTPGSDAFLGGADSRHSPDYHSTIDGLRLGPFTLPKMDAIGRDRDRHRIGGGIALVGMGLMRYFRLAFDLRDNLLHAWPGDAYRTLRRVGIDIEEGGQGPTIDRVIEKSPADAAGLKRGDVILAVDHDFAVHQNVPAARRALARAPFGPLPLWILRHGTPQKVELAMPPRK
ncbi:Hypothetical protein A7982_11993 [Minicystis rosea]|nr:Hypothetical protein A7982_11993 [Minicystis rosea]